MVLLVLSLLQKPNFNSIKVRLELLYLLLQGSHVVHFNSIKVRLEL